MKHTIYHFQFRKRKSPLFILICSQVFFSKGFKNEFETAVVNEPSEFEPLKFYCTPLYAIPVFILGRLIYLPELFQSL